MIFHDLLRLQVKETTRRYYQRLLEYVDKLINYAIYIYIYINWYIFRLATPNYALLRLTTPNYA